MKGHQKHDHFDDDNRYDMLKMIFSQDVAAEELPAVTEPGGSGDSGLADRTVFPAG